jgi:hypothetical protein
MRVKKTSGFIVVKDATTNADVDRVEVKNATPGKVDRVYDGMSINLDHDRFYLTIIYPSA